MTELSFLGAEMEQDDLPTHLKHLEQCLYVESTDAKRQTKNGRNNDEDQKQCDPQSERNAQQHA